MASTYYLSTNGGLFDESKSEAWVELDFEVLGKYTKPNQSLIWTNFFWGVALEHGQLVAVPFDASASFHTYTFNITHSSIAWLVDNVTYRTEDISSFGDMLSGVRRDGLRKFVSLWGRSSRDSYGYWDHLGVMDDNANNFPLHAKFVLGGSTPLLRSGSSHFGLGAVVSLICMQLVLLTACINV